MKITKSGLQIAMLALAVTGLSACLHDDDDDDDNENTPPIAAPFSFTTQTETAFTKKFPAADADKDALTYTIDSQPTLGNVTVNTDGSYTYQPYDEVTGNDSFSFTVTDTGGLTASSTVTITIEALEVLFTQFARDAFNAAPDSDPMSLNGREFVQDGLNDTDYQDLIDNN